MSKMRRPYVGCTNVNHNARDCYEANIPLKRWCRSCREQRHEEDLKR